MAEQTQFIDADNYQGGGKFDKVQFRDIALRQLQRISLNANCEFRGGYWETKEVPTGNGQTLTQRIYIPDTREVYSNSVMHLLNMIYPHADKELLSAFEKIEVQIKEAYNKFTNEPERTDQSEKQAEEYERQFSNVEQRTSFRGRKRELLEQLFREICCFLKRIDYFEGQTFEDEF